ncbi:MAG: heavy metal-binding domain-containing protein [Bryobacteraceae bacterium]
MRRRAFFPLLAAQTIPDFTCPMDPDVHSKFPGRCPRCGMNLAVGLPDPLEYRLHVEVLPRAPMTTRTTSLRLHVTHPGTKRRVEKFEEIHERLLHLFLISEDRRYFAHEHPEPEPGGYFRFHTNLPLPGFYRILTDFFPAGGTPQLLTAPLYVRGEPQSFQPPATPNLQVKLRIEPEKPIAGLKAMLFFDLNPIDGVMPWLGAWGHLLSASDDLLDLVHAHPAWEPYRNHVQFNLIFPRPGEYTLWAQFQRLGVVNTARFQVTASALA